MDVPSATRRIRLLSSLLANQIAAGEVVERPASVAKELLENSLDAGATRVEIDVEQGGAALIRVRDDGHGIRREDLPLALARHATSKVYNHDELMQVASLGFRGEALASIAAVSRLTLSSRSIDEGHGWSVGGEAEPVPTGQPVGTVVEVRDLFYNTPARRKFLRAERTEFEHLAEVVRRLALSRLDVGFALQHNQRSVLQLRPADDRSQRERRVATVCGRSFLEQAYAVEFELPGLRLWGWLARPEAARPQADIQYFYINGRIIRDRVVTHAVRQAYGDAILPGRHPAYVLYLEMEPEQVDVNVHPTKHEVRFRDTRRVHDFIYRALQQAVGGRAAAEAVVASAAAVAEADATYRTAHDVRAVPAGRRVLGAVMGRYLLVEEAAGLRLVDLVAARAAQAAGGMHRALLEGVPVPARPLLIPVVFAPPAAQGSALEAALPTLTRLGFELERLGPGQWVARRVPAALAQVPVEVLLRVLAERLAAGETAPGQLVELLHATAARQGEMPGREEWDGVLASVSGDIDGVSRILSPTELAQLLQSVRQ